MDSPTSVRALFSVWKDDGGKGLYQKGAMD